MNNRDFVRSLIHEAYYANRGQPVRSPFSHYREYNPGRPYTDTFQEITDLYNTTYRMLHQEDAFEEVHYSEPMNVLVAVPLEESEFDGPYAVFGLKAARGYHKDYRFIDKGIEGAGSYYINEEEVDMLLQNPKEAIEELNREYFGRIGMKPKSRDRLDESVVNEKSKSETQQRLFGMVYAYKQGELDLDDLDDDLAEKIKSIADDISMEDAKDFAETDHDDIPPEVKEEAFRKKARSYIRKHGKLKSVLSEQNAVRRHEGKKIKFIEHTKDVGRNFLHINFFDGTDLIVSGDFEIN